MRGASIRTVVMSILAALAVLAALRIAAGVIIPVVVSILTAFALDPVVRGFERLRIPRWLAAGVTVVGILKVHRPQLIYWISLSISHWKE